MLFSYHLGGAGIRRRPAAGGATDPYISNVGLLLGMDSGSIIDESPSALTLGTIGGVSAPTASTAQSMFGGWSMEHAGTGSITVPSSTLDMGSGDFTFECFFRINDTSSSKVLIVNAVGTGVYPWEVVWGTDNTIRFWGFTAGTVLWQAASTAMFTATNTWYYVGCKRYGTKVRVFGGTTLGGGTTAGTELDIGSNALITPPSSNYTIGAFDNGVANLLGYQDEIRITKGIARDLSLVPSAKFPRS